MSEWTREQVLDGQGNDKSEKWAHGLLRKIQVEYYKWGDTIDGVKQPSTPISYDEYKKLPRNDKGQIVGGGEKLTFEIDPTVLNPDLQFTTTRSLFRGFPDWVRVTSPSIKDVVGTAENALVEFAERAGTEEWYVEAQLVPVPNKNGKVNEVPRFTVMTKDIGEIRRVVSERFPKRVRAVPQDLLDSAKMYFERMAKRDLVKYKNWVESDSDAKSYTQELMDAAANW